MAAKQHPFSSQQRLKKRAEILLVQNTGRKLYSKDFILILLPKEKQTSSRLAVTVSRRVHKRAVRRNRIKRRLKELFRLNQKRLMGHFDILIIARKNAAQIDFAEMKRQVLGALHHHGYFNNPL